MSATQQQTLQRWIVKSVLSGDTIVVRGQPKGGPPPERTICLSNTQAPRIARRANPNVEGSTETKDDPYGWEAREYLRRKLIGREVAVSVEYKAPGTGREYGVVYLGKDASGENMTETMLAEGLLELRRMGLKADDPQNQKLIQIEEQAKAAGKGKWASDAASHVRSVTWTIENPRHYVDALHGKPVNAVIEHVRDGCTVRAFILPNFDYLTVMLSGIKCPMFKLDEATGKQVPEPYAEEAKFFTESRLLQRDVQIILEGVSNQNFLGTILHPNGNITELLLREGFARCVDWSMGVVSQGAEKLRAAEKAAKEKQARLWKDYKPSGPAIDTKDKSFSGKVVEVVNGDALVVKQGENSFKKIFLASIRPPRQSAEANENAPPAKDNKQRARPLYDIPYMLEAREFLRKKLIGKKVGVEIDYIQPANQGYPERTCCTITIGGINVAEALVSKGLATVIRYRMDDDQRSSQYDILLAAEERAKKKAVGMHSKKEPPIHRVADITGDVAKAKQFLPFLQRAGKSEAVVEFVASGSRLRLFIPRETCLITFLISGIDCPKAARTLPSGHVQGDPFGEEALLFTKELCMQREVEVEVETIDKGGNFIGWLYVDGVNLSVALVEAGLAKMHFTAERSNHHKTLATAEGKAKQEKLNIWSTHEEPQTVEVREEPTERKVNYKNVIATEVTDQLHFYVQFVEQGPKLEELMEKLTQEMEANPPLAGAHTPKKGELLAAQFSADNLWYRARVERISGSNVTVLFVDYGNRETMPSTKTATLPSQFHLLPPQASEYALACITVPEDDDQRQEAVDVLYHDIMNKQLKLNVEYRGAVVDHVTLQYQDSNEDVGRALVADGLVQVDARKEKRLASLVADYLSAQETAKSERRNIWRYGDFTEDDAREFGYKK